MPVRACSRRPSRRICPSAARSGKRALIRAALLLLPVLLAACAGHSSMNAQQEAARFAAEARRNYPPPGPPSDPWGPYITEASRRFDVPDRWIRAVMKVESGGHEFLAGRPITSPVGAMGLMQLMPATYGEMRAENHLGDDPYDPHNNILAGTAYLRAMYDLYGIPAFLAAYNAGPRRLDGYLAGNAPLPDEARRYVAMIAPAIAGTYPARRSPAEQLAYNRIPDVVPPGRRGSHALFAWNRPPSQPQPAPPRPLAAPVPVASRSLIAPITVAPVTAAPLPPIPAAAPTHSNLAAGEFAAATPASGGHGGSGFHLISQAVAEPLPARRDEAAGREWAIQVGAFASAAQAHSAALAARDAAHLAAGQPLVGMVQQARARLYRARLTGLSRAGAIDACERLARSHTHCLVLSPEAQS